MKTAEQYAKDWVNETITLKSTYVAEELATHSLTMSFREAMNEAVSEALRNDKDMTVAYMAGFENGKDVGRKQAFEESAHAAELKVDRAMQSVKDLAFLFSEARTSHVSYAPIAEGLARVIRALAELKG